MRQADTVNPAPDFFHYAVPHVSPMLGELMKSSSVEADASEGASGSIKPRRWAAMAPDRIALLTLITLFLWLNRSYMAYVAFVSGWVHTSAKAAAASGEGYFSTAARLIFYVAVTIALYSGVVYMAGSGFCQQR